jgi:hypothetical protein
MALNTPIPLQTTTKFTALSYTTLPDFRKGIYGSQSSPSCPSGNRNIYMKLSVGHWWNYTGWGKPNYSENNLYH